MWNPVETIDYIFDRYAYLNLEPDASAEAIRAAIKTRRLENHPDRLVKVGPEAKRAAETVMERLADCESVLLDDNRRPFFDRKLAEFKATRPRAISKNGTPMIVLDDQHFNVPVLLGQAQGGRVEEVLEHARVLTKYDPARTATLRRLYEKDRTDGEVRGMLVESLHAELMYYDALEEDAWQQAGISNKRNKLAGHLHDPLDYVELSREALEQTMAEEIPAMLGDTLGLARIGMAAPALLLPPPDKAAASLLPARLEDVRVEDLVAQVRKVMETKQAIIDDAARRKQEVITELAELVDTTWLSALPRQTGAFTIMLMMARNDGEEPVAVLAIEGHDDTTHLRGNEAHEGIGKTAAQIMGLALAHDTLAVSMAPETGQPLVVVVPAIRRRRKELGLPPLGQVA